MFSSTLGTVFSVLKEDFSLKPRGFIVLVEKIFSTIQHGKKQLKSWEWHLIDISAGNIKLCGMVRKWIQLTPTATDGMWALLTRLAWVAVYSETSFWIKVSAFVVSTWLPATKFFTILQRCTAANRRTSFYASKFYHMTQDESETC